MPKTSSFSAAKIAQIILTIWSIFWTLAYLGTKDNCGFLYDCPKLVQGFPLTNELVFALLGFALILVTFIMKLGFASKTAPQAPTQTASPTASVEQELQKAADMLQKGLIDEAEFKELKKKIIDRA